MPQQAIDAAKTAVAAAQNAKAAQYASAELLKAQSHLNSAIAEQQMNNVFQAKSFAVEARTQAEAAMRISQQRQQSGAPQTPVAPPATAAKPSTPTASVTPTTPKIKGGRKMK